jgi:Caspase domain
MKSHHLDAYLCRESRTARRRAGRALLWACLLLAAASPAFGQDPLQDPLVQPYLFEEEPKRVALVVGNENYKHLSQLKSSRTDGENMAQRLRELGFDVVYRADVPTLEAFEDDALEELRAKITKGAFVIFYFSGHGFSYGAHNYLVPTDVPLTIKESKVTQYAISVDSVRDVAASRRPGLIMFFIDACRTLGGFVVKDEQGNNLVGKGPKEMKPRPDTINFFIAYSADFGKISTGINDPTRMSIFTDALYNNISREGESFNSVYLDIATWVLVNTNHDQNPGSHNWSKTDPYFRPTPLELERDKRLWHSAVTKRHAATIETFCYRHSASRYSAACRKWITDDLYRAQPTPYTAVSPEAVERAWNRAGSARASLLRMSLPHLALTRSLEESEARALSLLSDESIGMVSDQASTQQDEVRQLNLDAITSHGEAVATDSLKARARPSASAAVVDIPSGAELKINGIIDGADGVAYISALTRGNEQPFYLRIPELSGAPKFLELGLSAKEIEARPLHDGHSALVDPASIGEAVADLREEGWTITWVSLSTGRTEDESERDLRTLRLADAEYALKRAGIAGTRITSVSGREDFSGSGVRIRFFGIR